MRKGKVMSTDTLTNIRSTVNNSPQPFTIDPRDAEIARLVEAVHSLRFQINHWRHELSCKEIHCTAHLAENADLRRRLGRLGVSPL